MSEENYVLDRTEFASRAYTHIEKLCRFGTRSPGSKAEEETVEYLTCCFSELGMDLSVEPFEFASFQSRDRTALLNEQPLFFRSAFLNRTGSRGSACGECLIADSGVFNEPKELEGKIVLTDRMNDILYLKDRNPEAVLVLRSEDLREIGWSKGLHASLEILGERRIKPIKSHNVIAHYSTGSTNELFFTAHWDSTGGSGARDNASGVAAMIELARILKQSCHSIPCSFRFIATGAEESGLVGSVAYVARHSMELGQCIGVLNMDGVVSAKEDDGKPYLSMSPPSDSWLREIKVDTEPVLRLISIDGFNTAWYVSGTDLYWSSPTVNKEWIREGIVEVLHEANIEFVEGACCSGTDDRSFAFMGVPTIQQGFISEHKENVGHTEYDVPHQHFKSNLVTSGMVALLIVKSLTQDGRVRIRR